MNACEMVGGGKRRDEKRKENSRFVSLKVKGESVHSIVHEGTDSMCLCI